MNESYECVEKAVVFRPELRNWQSSVRNGLLEAGVDSYNGFSLEHLVGKQIGGSTFYGSGRRHSAADLLNYANPVNIQVVVYGMQVWKEYYWHLLCNLRGLGYLQLGWFTGIRWEGITTQWRGKMARSCFGQFSSSLLTRIFTIGIRSIQFYVCRMIRD